MPTYGYQCVDCKNEFSVFQSMKDDPVAVCPDCAGFVKRLLYPVGIVFKGSGWYINDSRKPDTSENGAAPAEKKDGEDKGSETKPASSAKNDSSPSTATEAKAETKSESASKAADSS